MTDEGYQMCVPLFVDDAAAVVKAAAKPQQLNLRLKVLMLELLLNHAQKPHSLTVPHAFFECLDTVCFISVQLF